MRRDTRQLAKRALGVVLYIMPQTDTRNLQVDPGRSETELLKAWRSVAQLAFPLGILAFIALAYAEWSWYQNELWAIAYGLFSLGLIVGYVVFSYRLDLLRLVFYVSIVSFTVFYTVRLVFALFVEDRSVLANVGTLLTWAPVVVLLDFFALDRKHVGYSRLMLGFTLIMALVPAFYWLPRLIAGVDLGVVLVLAEFTLAMLFCTCALYALGVANVHYERIGESADELRRLALVDELTGLPNKLFLTQRLVEQVDEPSHPGVALAHLNLDRFKTLGARYGTQAGNELLQQVAKRLQAALGDDAVYRFGADDFAVVSTDVGIERPVERFGKAILKAFDKPFYLDAAQVEVSVSASIGIGMYPGDALDGPGLLHHAEQAMQTIKSSGRNGYWATDASGFADDALARELRAELSRRFSWENFKLDYQPVLGLENGEAVGAEAQLSWRSLQGMVPIAELRDALSRSGDSVTLERAVLERICFDAVRSSLANISVDISPLHFAQSDLVLFVRKLLSETGLDARRLTLEIGFGTLNSNLTVVQEAMEQFSDMGVYLALDEVGYEYVSSSLLATLPLVGLKLHPRLLQSYMLGREQATFARTLTAALIEQAHSAGLSVTAVGVDNEIQAKMLRQLGCDRAQGSLWGPLQATVPGARVTQPS